MAKRKKRSKGPAGRTQIWRTKDGRRVRICEMEDTHLLNTIAFLKRNAEQKYLRETNACASLSFQGEQAQYEQDQFLLNASWEDYLPNMYYFMVDEANYRNLTLTDYHV